MIVRLDRELKNLVAKLATVGDLVQAEQFQDARRLLLQGRTTAKELGLPYARIAWELCIVLNHLGETEEALRMAIEALDQDPLVPDYRRSFLIVAEKLNHELSALAPVDPSIPRIHALLAANDAAEDEANIAMARHLEARGDLAGARRLLEAVTTLSPHCTKAWELLAEVMAALGDEEARSDCAFEVLTLELGVATALRTRKPPSA